MDQLLLQDTGEAVVKVREVWDVAAAASAALAAARQPEATALSAERPAVHGLEGEHRGDLMGRDMHEDIPSPA